VDRIFLQSDRNPRVLNNLAWMYNHGRLAGTGYLSILPVDQGIEHSGGASFAKNPDYFDPENIIKLAMEGGCNAVASTFGVLGLMSRKYAHKIPFIVKINHNELLTYPNSYEQILFGTVEQAYDMGAAAVGATIYFGSDDSHREIIEIAEAFCPRARTRHGDHPVVLPAQLRLQKGQGLPRLCGPDRAGEPSRRDHLRGHHQAETAREQRRFSCAEHGRQFLRQTGQAHVQRPASDHPIDLCRYQVANCYMGRAG
jgi:fructose-bisphosphate aldolase, class I